MDNLKEEILRQGILTRITLNSSRYPLLLNDTHVTTPQVADYYYSFTESILGFSDRYRAVHGYLASVICILGIIANLCNIVVLTRKNMVSSTNCILCGLAVSDGLTMVAYLPFALRFYCLYGTQPSPERNTLPAIRYMLFFACFSVIVHTVSILLTLTLTIFRCIFVHFPNYRRTWCSLQRAKIAVFTVIILAILLSVPNILTLTIEGCHNVNSTGSHNMDDVGIHFVNNQSSNIFANSTIWRVTFRDNMDTHKINFWVQAIMVKLLPCVILTVLSIKLIHTIHRVDIRKAVLLGRRTHHSSDKMTILLAVVLLFLLTELPHGILSLLSGVLDNFVYEVYEPMGDFLDILALLNNSLNFVLYCTMSKKFKVTFNKTLLSPINIGIKKISIFLYYLSPYSYIN